MIECPACSNNITEGGRSCPACGQALDESCLPTRPLAAEPAAPASDVAAGQMRGRGEPPLPLSGESIEESRFVPGDRLADRYRIVGLLGRGGMGEVYRADDLKLKQSVALKFLSEKLTSDGAALTRFYQEVSLARQISHRHVCRLYDIGEAAGQHFISMEYVKGEELASLLKRIGHLPSDKAVEIARQLCAGLAAIHEKGVLHRDLKPSNVMIDERGNVRITDFGLAGVAQEIRGRETLAGTPTYMSPEQLEGRELTARSDIYSLGLTLYEVFTGKRAFEAATLPELVRLHRSTKRPKNPSVLVADLNPLVERVILRCLERDPAKRPASAIQVSAALPGGDPIAAALAAGETPSPEMVAAAPKEGTLRPAVAVAFLASVLIGLSLVVLLSGKVMLHQYVPLEKSPDVLRERARDVIKRLGYIDVPTDSAYGFTLQEEYLRYVREHDSSPGRWDRLRGGQPAAVLFWYRQSPRYLIPERQFNITVSPDDPPPLLPGMTSVLLDTQGRLVGFDSVPPLVEGQGTLAQAPDWSALFAGAELDLAKFTPADPKWVPPVSNDVRAAWEGTYPHQPQIPVRVEAAGFRGRPIFFHIIEPWTKPERVREASGVVRDRASQLFGMILILTAVTIGVLLARNNLRSGRGDRKGAFRLAVFILSANMLAWVLLASHIPTFDEYGLLLVFSAGAVLNSCLVWLFYISLEPYVRRRWPHRIISWSRLLSGGWRDPLVGRDVLLGVLFGVAIALLIYFSRIVPQWFGSPPNQPLQDSFSGTMLGVPTLLGRFLLANLRIGIFFGLGSLFLLVLFHTILRRDWLAICVYWLLLTLMIASMQSSNLLFSLFFTGSATAMIIFLLARIGLLVMIVSYVISGICFFAPITTDLSAWYAGSSLFALCGIVALAVYGFYTSLAGQPLFRGGSVQD